ncbi:MAG: hypothetical protein LBR26_05355 [Prevotella sp.]|jgi:hypothetical protein|nr:hypothetical protein [Prevotella sp.]
MWNLGYITAFGTKYDGRIQKIAKSTDKLRPVYEAFINAYEAIKNLSEGKIVINIQLNKNLYSEQNKSYEFDNITIEDNGIGFNDKEFTRFLNLDDTSKGIGNKGSGRVQFIHFFEKAEYESVFEDISSSTGFRKRIFTLSKNEAFINENAIVRLDADEETTETNPYTILKLSIPLESNPKKPENREYFKTISEKDLKESLKNKFLALFCDSRENMPEIKIQRTINGAVDSENEKTITIQDIPNVDKSEDIDVYYSKINMEGKIEKSTNFETLNLKSFKINSNDLQKNSIKLVSKGEIAKEIKLDSLASDDLINGNRYLFLLSGNIINGADTDTRGNLHIPTEADFKKSYGDPDLFPEEVITIDEIRETANGKIHDSYPEIIEHTKEKQIELESLRDMFLLNDETIRKAKIKPTDDEETVLEKIYKADSELVAKKDIEIKKRIDALNRLTPNSTDYQKKLDKEVKELTRIIPLQNRTSLTQYIARRKMVLSLFQKTLDYELDKLKNGGRIDEKIMHNLIFQQSSNNPEDSDLWLIAEEFVHFGGVSETELKDIKYKGEKIFDKDFSEEEQRYLNSLGEKRLTKRPDILLFPEEEKCIIIELKAPDVNVSEHLTQIDFYASLLKNYTSDKIQLTTFFGYLIGEDIEDRDVRGRVSRFEHSQHLNYWFRPSEKVIGFSGRSDGSIYTEVIKYSSLLERAKLRNKIFIDKLGK